MNDQLKMMLEGAGIDTNDTKGIDRIPLCYKCSNRCLQDFFDVDKGEIIRGSELVGGKKLGVESWKKGWYRDKDDGLIWQHNCPLLVDILPTNKFGGF